MYPQRACRLRAALSVLIVLSVRSLLPALALFCLVLPASAVDIPFDFVDGYILVHARVGAHPVTLILDSGASASVLSLQAARRLHLAVGHPQPVDGVDADATAFDMAPVTPKAQGSPSGNFRWPWICVTPRNFAASQSMD